MTLTLQEAVTPSGVDAIIVVEPGDATAFEALEESLNVVVKLPGANDDKYVVEENKI